MTDISAIGPKELTKEHFSVNVNQAVHQFSIIISAILKEQNLSFEGYKSLAIEPISTINSCPPNDVI